MVHLAFVANNENDTNGGNNKVSVKETKWFSFSNLYHFNSIIALNVSQMFFHKNNRKHTSSFSTVWASGMIIWPPENLMGRNPGSEHALAFSDEAK